MLCPICGKSIESISNVVSLCESCQAAQPTKAPASENQNSKYEEPIKESFLSGDYEPAGFWLRVCAWIIDGAVIFIIYSLVSIFMLAVLGVLIFLSPVGFFYPLIAGMLVYSLTILIGAFILPPLLESSKLQGTIGKYAIGLRVTNENGTRIGFGKAFIRSIIRLISQIFFFLGCIPAGITAKKQAVHDMMCGTLVVVYKKVPAINIGAYVIISLFVTGGISYFTQDKEDHRSWKKDSFPMDKLESKINELENKYKVSSRPNTIYPANNQINLPKIEIKTVNGVAVISSPASISSPADEPGTMLPSQNAGQKATPLPTVDESKLSEFDRRVLVNKRIKESGGH